MEQPHQFQDMIGQSTLIRRLLTGMESGRIVHACIFTGDAGTGKRTLARLYAKALLCRDPGQQGSCGVCPSCRKVEQGSHPDLHWLDAGQKDGGVDAVRAVIGEISLCSYDGGRRVVVVEDAQNLSIAAQNALLKTIEEPPEGVVLMLLTPNLAPLLSTILSRCALYRTLPVPQERIAAYLQVQEVSPERAQACARMANGSIGKALAVLEDEEYWPLWQQSRQILRAVAAGGGGAQALGFLQDNRKNFPDILTIWENDLRDHVLQDAQKAPVYMKLLEECMRARERAYYNVAYSTLCDTLIFSMISLAAA